MNSNRTSTVSAVVVGALTVGLFVLSVLLATVAPGRDQRRLLWFPDVVGRREVAEWHYLPYRSSREEQIRAYIEEIILGPVTLGAVPYIPRQTAIRLVILGEDRTVYVDFDDRILFSESGRDETDFGAIAERLDRSLKHNFRFVERVVITVQGQLPGQPRFAVGGR